MPYTKQLIESYSGDARDRGLVLWGETGGLLGGPPADLFLGVWYHHGQPYHNDGVWGVWDDTAPNFALFHVPDTDAVVALVGDWRPTPDDIQALANAYEAANDEGDGEFHGTIAGVHTAGLRRHASRISRELAGAYDRVDYDPDKFADTRPYGTL